MQNSNLAIMPGSRVVCFDLRLYINDVKTPLSHTMRPATVVQRYGVLAKQYYEYCVDDDLQFRKIPSYCLGPYPDLIDVVFDYRAGVSKGHFTNGATLLSLS